MSSVLNLVHNTVVFFSQPPNYFYVSRDKYPERENEMDGPSFEGFHTQLDCKLMY